MRSGSLSGVNAPRGFVIPVVVPLKTTPLPGGKVRRAGPILS
jgi:hypothetical protein